MDFEYLHRAYKLAHIPITVWKDGDFKQFPSEEEFKSPFSTDGALKIAIDKVVLKENRPFFYFEDSQIYYGVFKADGYVIAFGPMARHSLTKEHVEAYFHTHMMKDKILIQNVNMAKMAGFLTFNIYALTGNKVDDKTVTFFTAKDEIDDWDAEEDAESFEIEYSEKEKTHSSVEYEQRLCRIVREGDVQASVDMLSENDFDVEKYGGDVAVNSFKKMEYYVVTLLTLLSRAAIEGGLRPEVSLTLSDIYMRKLEACKNISEIMMVGSKAQMDYTEKVHKAKTERSKYVYIEECKDYIAKNLRKPFKVGDIAPAIGVNRSYLARKFSEIEGMTIQQYIVNERCNHAANLLKYSDYPISIISEYFCFSSQSHFGKQFKEIYGMTPHEYRGKNKYIEA